MADLIWKIRQGDSLVKTFTFYQKLSEQAEKTPLDMTGASAKIQIRSNEYDKGVLISLSTDEGSILPLSDDGRIVIIFNDLSHDTGTNNCGLANASFDIKVTFSNGQVKTYPRYSVGTIELTKGITQ